MSASWVVVATIRGPSEPPADAPPQPATKRQQREESEGRAAHASDLTETHSHFQRRTQDRVHGPRTLRSRPCCVPALDGRSPPHPPPGPAPGRGRGSARRAAPLPRPRRLRRRRCSSCPSRTPPHTPPARCWRTTAVLRAPRRFDLVGLRWARGSHVQAQIRARVAGGRWTRWTPLHAAHAPDGERAPAGTDPAFTGAADEIQLRLRGSARGLRLRFVRALPHAPAPRARAAQAARPADPAARRLGRRAGAAAIRPELRDGAGGVRPPHGERRRLRARGVAGDHPRDRALPPRLQRLERHRLQLPRRPLRRDLGGPCGRRRGRRRRRPGAGLQQQLDRHRLPRHVHEPAARRARDGVAREADRLEAVAARRAGAGTGDADLRRRPEQPLSRAARR